MHGGGDCSGGPAQDSGEHATGRLRTYMPFGVAWCNKAGHVKGEHWAPKSQRRLCGLPGPTGKACRWQVPASG